MNRKYLKGFSRFSIFPITENTEERYIVGDRVSIPSAQTLSKDLETEEEDINADDELWDKDRSVKGENFTITFKELPDELRSKLEGGRYDAETGEYDFSTTDNAPEFACTYRGLRADGTYKMFRQYRAKVNKIKEDLETKGNGKSSSVEVSGIFMGRACDNKLVTTKSTEEGNAGLTWLDTIPSVPAVEPGEENQGGE